MKSKEIYYTRSIFGSRVQVEKDGAITKTVIESPWLPLLRQAKRAASKIGRDSVEVARVIKELLKIDTVQNIGGLGLVLLAYLNQEPELPQAQSNLSLPQQEFRTDFTIAPSIEKQSSDIIEAKTMIEEYQLTEQDYQFLDRINNKMAFYWQDWNGKLQRIYIPEDVYQDAKTVGKEEDFPWYALIAIGLTETGYYDGARWNPRVVSHSGALGRYQIMPFNFPTYQPYEGGDPFDPLFNAWTAVRKLKHMGMGDIPKEGWVKKFIAIGGWNQHLPQAQTTWALKEALKREYLQIISP